MKIQKNYIQILIAILVILVFTLTSCMTSNQTTSINGRQSNKYATLKNDQLALSHYLNGLSYKEARKFNEALIELNKALSYDSNYAICYTTAQIYYELGNLENAESLLETAIQQKSNYVEAYKMLFEIYSNEGRELALMSKIAEKIFESEPNNENKFKFASFLSFSDSKKANNLFFELLESEYKINALNSLIQNYRLSNDTLNMLKYLEQLYLTDKTNYKIANELTFYYLQNFANKNRFLPILTEMDNSLSMNYLSNIYLAVLRRTMELDIDSNFAYLLIDRINGKFDKDSELTLYVAKLLYKLNNIKQSDYYFDKAYKSDLEIPEILLDITNFFIFSEKFEKSLHYAEIGSQNFKKDYRFPYLQSLIYSSLNDNVKAKEYIILSTILDSNFSNAWSQLGLIYDREKNADSADYCYEKALSKATNPDALTLNNYAYSLADRNKELQKAKLLSLKSLELEPNNFSFLDTYGWICFKLQDYNQAIDYLVKSHNLDPNNTETLEHLGSVFLEMGKDNEAMFYLTKALTLDPKNKNIETKIKLLKK